MTIKTKRFPSTKMKTTIIILKEKKGTYGVAETAPSQTRVAKPPQLRPIKPHRKNKKTQPCEMFYELAISGSICMTCKDNSVVKCIRGP